MLFDRYIPPVGFYYTVNLLDPTSLSPMLDAGFQEVSGLSYKMETETIKEGGENRFVHKVPGRVTYDPLVLKRGLIVKYSTLGIWCREHLEGGLREKIEPKDISVMLLDAGSMVSKPIMAWIFVNAYPSAWEVSDFKAKESALVIESLKLVYSYYWVEDRLGLAGYPSD